jgi:hypothetical protein
MTADVLAELLADRAPVTADERLEEAESLLRAERQRRAQRVASALFDTGWRVFDHASPGRALRSARRLFGSVREIGSRSRAEDQALDLLEGVAKEDSASERLQELYADLREREREARVRKHLEEAEGALERGRHRLARVHLRRALKHDPGSEQAFELLSRMEPLTVESAGGLPLADISVDPWEVGLSAALLVEDYDRALGFSANDPNADLGHAVARYLGGEREQGADHLKLLSARNDAAGDLARSWIEQADFDVERALAEASGQYRRERALGWLGGDELAESGMGLDRDALRAWGDSASPGNLVLAAPLRLYRHWRPDHQALRAAAHNYLAVEPDGERAEEAAAWLTEFAHPPLERGWDDGRFVLPRARTRYVALTPRPLLLTRRVLDSEFVGEVESLRAILGDGQALRLLPRRRGADVDAVPPERALTLLAELAAAVEQGSLEAHECGPAALLDGIERLDRAVRGGMPLVVEPWSPERREATDSMVMAMAEGESVAPADLELERGDDDVRMERAIGRASFACPEESLCVDREEFWSASVHGEFAMNANFKVGARTRLERASFALEVGRTGPQAALVLPVSHWLGVERWIPFEARLAVSLSGISFDPRVDGPQHDHRAVAR